MNSHNFIKNPYIFGKPIYKKEQLYGREKIIEAIKYNFRNNIKITFLHVQRRIGKTSLINCLPQLFTDEQNGFKFVTFSFQGYKDHSIPVILDHLADDISFNIDRLPKKVRELTDDSYNFFQLFLPEIINQYLSGKKLVLLLDEFDVLGEDPTIDTPGKYLFNRLEQVVKQEEKLFAILVFGRPLKDITYLKEFLEKEDRELIEVGLLDKESTRNLIVNPAKGKLEYESDAINAIWQLSAGHPFLTQLLCFYIFKYCRGKGIKKVACTDVELILEEAMEGSRAVLQSFIEPLNQNEKLFFRAVAEAQESPEEQLKTTIINWQSVGKRLVEEYGFLEEKKDQTGYKIKVELVRRWLVKNYPLSNEEKLQMLETPHSQDASTYFNLGSLYEQEELWEQAINYYQKAIALKPDFVEAYRNLAKAWSQIGKQAEAADCLYQAYTLEPENITPKEYLNLGNTFYLQDQFTNAIFCYQWAIKLNPNNPTAYHNLAVALKRKNKLHETATYAQKAREIRNGVLEKTSTVAKQVEVNDGKPQLVNSEDVMHLYTDKQVPEKLPQVNQADLIKEAEANLVNGKFYEAIATCEEIISVKPDAVAYQIMGKTWVEMNQIDEAIAAYQKSLEVKPNFAEVYVSLGELYFKQQREEEAVTAYKKGIKLAPDLKDGYRGLVEVLLAQGKVDEAEELSYNALIQHPSWATPQEFCTLGHAFMEQGKIEKGITCFEEAIKLDPKLWEAHHILAEIFRYQKKVDKAIKHYRKLVELMS